MTSKNYTDIAELIEQRAPAITMTELADLRSHTRGGQVVQLRSRSARSGVAVAAMIGAAAAVLAVVAGSPQLWASTGQPQAVQAPARPGPSHHFGHVRLTDAMVRRIARASRVALAPAGHVLERLTDVLGAYPDGSDLFDITFSHRNYNQVTQPGSLHPQIVRVVDGRIFFFGNPPPGQPLQWYLSTTQTSRGQSVPDPRTLLSALQPTAGFEDLGQEVIDGVQVDHLRATNLVGLRKDLRSLGDLWEPLSQFDIWVDSSGVIRLMGVNAQGPSQPSGLLDKISVTIKFLDIGQPETIVAPKHYGLEATHG